MTTRVHLVPHTHWDREWHLPFQLFRIRLVSMVDGLLDILDEQDDFRFTMDGQMAAIDDYLAIRPEAEQRIRSFVAEGRLAIGPWQILLDEFLPSGETIVRNLELGWERASRFGSPMPVGYLPDMFGHIAQMPQILVRAGIEHAVLWRGVPAKIRDHVFDWTAPDGSTVRTEYLVGGYGNAAYLLDVPGALEEKVAIFEQAVAPYFDGDDRLAMLGSDHRFPDPETVERVEEVNRTQDRFELRISTLHDYIDRTAGTGPGEDPERTRWTGEMRSSARANILMGVTSARVDVKAAAAAAERRLERYAEPLLALHGNDWPERFLDLAWENIIANCAHDSITGCGRDEVAGQVLVRYAEAEQIASGLVDQLAGRIAEHVPWSQHLVLNPCPAPREDLVELERVVPHRWEHVDLRLPDGRRIPAQQEPIASEVLLDAPVPAERVTEIFGMMHGRELFGRTFNAFSIEDVGEGRRLLTYRVGAVADPQHLDVDGARADIETAATQHVGAAWRVRIVEEARRRLRALVPVPPLGVTTISVGEGQRPPAGEVQVSEGRLENRAVVVTVNDDGTFDLAGGGGPYRGVGRIVDGGDAGDAYNFAPPVQDALVETPADVRLVIVDDGPLIGRIRIERAYRWPRHLDDGARRRTTDSVAIESVTELELRSGEPFLRVRVAFDNRASDHRVRLHIPLPRPTERSWAEGQFTIVERGTGPGEAGHGEVAIPTYPARGFVAVPGLAVLLNRTTEYEVVEEGNELALTLVRSVGAISRNTNRLRREPAGPEVPIPGAQCLGPVSHEFALLPFSGPLHEAGVLDVADHYHHPVHVARGSDRSPEDGGHPDRRPPSMGTFEVRGENVVLSSLRRRGAELEVRIACEGPEATTCRLGPDVRAAREVDLLGRELGYVAVNAGHVELPIGAWEIRTVRIDRGPT